ncbi:MAG: methyltransferase domain-containing protein [Burkholderiales bacterium]|nr:methyltransferase domain-containing protein [Burkholderiales bacterium]
MRLTDLDFAQMYRQHMAEVGRPKSSEVWDARAAELGVDPRLGQYGQALVDQIDLSDCQSLLDVGCGGGAITLELARRLPRVHGIDFSAKMLEHLQQLAQSQSIHNVTCQLKSWEDDWHDVPVCDVVLASRSTAVMDMEQALTQLHSKARKRVYLTSLVGGQFADARLLNIIQRKRVEPLPGHLYVINILGQMGLRPTLDYITSTNRYSGARDAQAFIDLVVSGLGPLSASEQAHLLRWVDQQGSMAAIDAAIAHQWALISWCGNKV